MAMFDKMYTVDEVAQLASVTSRTIRNYLKSGRLQGRKIGGQWRFTEQNVQDLLNGAINDFSTTTNTETKTNNPNIPTIQNIPSYETAQPPKTISQPKRKQSVTSTFYIDNNEKKGKIEKKEPNIFDEFSSDSLFQEFADEAFDDRPNAILNLSSNKKSIHQIPKTKKLSNKILKTSNTSENQSTKINAPKEPTSIGKIESIQPNDNIDSTHSLKDDKQIKKSTTNIPQDTINTVHNKNKEIKQDEDISSKTFSSVSQEKLYPDISPTSTDSVNLTHIGKKVARFASEVHDCSKENQICSMIDTSQTLQDAKKMIVKLADISRQESANGTLCQVYTEYDERFSIARYTLFGTTSFIERCLSILNNS